MFTYLRLVLPMVLLAAVAGCGPDYSPNTYSTAAVQQANKVDQGVIAGFREIAIRADGTVGAVTGGAAGGVLGAQEPEGGVVTALSAIGGTLVGGIIGTSVEHAAGDTKAFEYIVRKSGGDLVAVAQKDQTPLPVGLKVLVIEGKQARIVADYTAPLEVPAPSAAKNDKTDGSKSEKNDKVNEAKTNAANGVTTNGAASGPAQAPQPTPAAATQPATEPHAADSGPATQSDASQPPAPQAPAPQANGTSAAEAAPSSPAPQQPVPTAVSPPVEDGAAPPAPATPVPADSKPSP